MPKYPMSDMIVLLPGITGSKLDKNGDTVWGLELGAALKGIFSGGNALYDALKIEPGSDPDPNDGVEPVSLLNDLHLIPGCWKIDGYSKIAKTLKNRFELQPDQNYFEFPYDWRLDNRVAARRLETLVNEKLPAWRTQSGNDKAELILIAHSMGGLVSQYYLEVLDGWKHANALITFGTPFEGSMNALTTLANGVKKLGLTIGPITRLLRTFPSMYQLLPTYPCLEISPQNYQNLSSANQLPNMQIERVKAAAEFQTEIKSAITSNQKEPGYLDAGYQLHPAIGLAHKTNLTGVVEDGHINPSTLLNGTAYGGDGTVPRFSASPRDFPLPPFRFYGSASHGSIQNADAVLDHINGVLSETEIPLLGLRTRSLMGTEVEDVILADEPVRISATPKAQVAQVSISLISSSLDPDQMQPVDMQQIGDFEFSADFGLLPPGAYQFVCEGPDVQRTIGSFAVADIKSSDLGG